MNLARPSLGIVKHVFRLWLKLRRFLPKSKCRAFGADGAGSRPSIEKIYVINLDREPGRWSEMEQELGHILDSSGCALLSMAERRAAVDGNRFLHEPTKDPEIDPTYTLDDQLFVEPQPLTLPTQFELNAPIRMSRAEVAVAMSHINVWREIAAGAYRYGLVLEDDVWFHAGFARSLEQAWEEVTTGTEGDRGFDLLYLSYLEVKHGAPKASISNSVFRPVRGLWHLCGYVLSREGAQALLRLLPCRGPIDLWINHQFAVLDVHATKRSIISQRRDAKSTNSYSILPALTAIGAITSEEASLFHIRPTEYPVFAFGPHGSGLSSLAGALSMLGYRCCSDLQELPAAELERLLENRGDRIFDAYVNVGSLERNAGRLRNCYPKAKFILTASNGIVADDRYLQIQDPLRGADTTVLSLEELNKWQIVCDHLRCAPPSFPFPMLNDVGQRPVLDVGLEPNIGGLDTIPKRDRSPWVIEPRTWWHGIRAVDVADRGASTETLARLMDPLNVLNTSRWFLRSDTFTDNLALFRHSNVEFSHRDGAALSIRNESLGVRNYSAASLCSRNQYLFGRFEAHITASGIPGVITGFFLHRNSPRQEIDIEIPGSRPGTLLINVFYNPGGEGARFDYGYRGAPTYIDLGFDASKGSHSYAIEWSACEIRWLVDDRLVHRRVIWDPTPIPDLPMTLHVNIWPPRSPQLAGRISKRRLPATALVGSIALQANSVLSTAGQRSRCGQMEPQCSTLA